MAETLWVTDRDEHGWRATEYTDKNGKPDLPTGTVTDYFETRPDLEAKLIKMGVASHQLRDGDF